MPSKGIKRRSEISDALQTIAREGTEMRKRHMREQHRDDLVMKILFACMCPPLVLFPGFWRGE
jgi:hypothetical protein